ncbi:MAG: dihydropteroate synthase [Deltaproteobacteria bacterium]|nr:MAG: dihydropteroate synthase [Deltaproteobacteria bacterium]
MTLKCGGKTLKVGRHPRVMGIINVTPDSFSDGGVHYDRESAIDRAHQMVEEGVDIIDVGGESSRPGSNPVEAREELSRVIPIISRLAKELPVPISIDTTKSEVARAALDAGAGMINDISGLHWDLKLAELAAKYEVPVIVMHTRGKPKTMQQEVHYESLISEIIRYLKEGIEVALASGVPESQIIVDPGIGFGKTVENNLEIMNSLFELSVLGKPILLGASRKTFIGKVLDLNVSQRLEGTLATTIYGIVRGADIVRVHDVKENVRAVRMLERMMGIDEEA